MLFHLHGSLGSLKNIIDGDAEALSKLPKHKSANLKSYFTPEMSRSASNSKSSSKDVVPEKNSVQKTKSVSSSSKSRKEGASGSSKDMVPEKNSVQKTKSVSSSSQSRKEVALDSSKDVIPDQKAVEKTKDVASHKKDIVHKKSRGGSSKKIKRQSKGDFKSLVKEVNPSSNDDDIVFMNLGPVQTKRIKMMDDSE